MLKNEGLSIASIETMFCVLSLLIFDTYGLRYVVIDNYNGILLKDLNEMDKKILELYNLPELRKTYSENSIKFAKEKFSMERSVKEIIESYKK
ncbi:MAG: glycosyltransferase [Melioribacteraceae bacterium]